MNSKDAFDYYETRFAEAALKMPRLNPADKNDSIKIKNVVKECLGIKDEWIPQINAEAVKTVKKEKYSIEFLTFTSWENVYGAAHLYIPEQAKFPLPLVIVCCGHGGHCKLNEGYQAMAGRLARQGAVVLVPDNIGQGERQLMGHRDAVRPFACGTSLKGMTVMETLAWLNWAEKDDRIDNEKMAAIGNSGGGALTLFLAALSDKLSVLSCSGYPTTFEYVARKEKHLCACNILPNIVGQVDMWQFLGLFAPRPLFIFQGKYDNMFPDDMFHVVCRKVGKVYSGRGATENFEFNNYEGTHAWDIERRFALGDFLSRRLGLEAAEKLDDDQTDILSSDDTCFEKWPENALDAGDAAVQMTGKEAAPNLKLSDVYTPPKDLNAGNPIAIRCDVEQILAQFEAFLTKY